jgi:hypothetical protein
MTQHSRRRASSLNPPAQHAFLTPRREAQALTRRLANAAAALGASLLVACGGGGNEPAAASADAQISAVTKLTPATLASERVRVLAEQDQAERLVPEVLPGDPDWNTEKPCTAAGDFVRLSGATDDDKSILSRHVYCLTAVPLSQDINVDLMRNANDTGWEFYKATAGRPATTFRVGTAVIQTQFQAYGPPTGLFKDHRLRYEIKSWVADSTFPLGAGSYSATITPRMVCQDQSYGSGASGGTCGSLQFAAATVSLTNNAKSPDVSSRVTFNWNFSAGSGNFDWASFRVYPSALVYKVNNTARLQGLDEFIASVDSSDGRLTAQEIRCDKKVVDGSSGSGCILVRATPVFVMDASKDPVLDEAAQHARDAQRKLSPGQTVLSPGRFTLKAGTRAIVADRGEPQYQGMERANAGEDDLNRNAACNKKKADSLFNTRPFSGSATCPNRNAPSCSCDEYPFAATRSGGAFAPDSTSVRYINKSSNEKSGSRLAAFYTNNRIMRPEAYFEKFWVEPIPSSVQDASVATPEQ